MLHNTPVFVCDIQKPQTNAASVGASTAPSEAESLFEHEDTGIAGHIDFDEVPVPADMLRGDKIDALGFGMFDIFDIAEHRRKQRDKGV